MGNEVTKKTVLELDGFSGYTSECEGDDDVSTSGGVIQGTKIKFLDPHWYNTVTEELMTGTTLIAIGVARVVNKWGPDNKPLVTRILAPGEKFPNFKQLNADCPKSEWREKFGEKVGPWSGQHCLYFVDDLVQLNRYTWPSPLTTVGSTICVEELVQQIQLVRRFNGPDVHPVTVLGHTAFKTGYGLRQRPYLLTIPQWITPDGQTTLPPTRGTLPPASGNPGAAAASGAGGAPAGTRPVSKPTAKEVTGDEIIY